MFQKLVQVEVYVRHLVQGFSWYKFPAPNRTQLYSMQVCTSTCIKIWHKKLNTSF